MRADVFQVVALCCHANAFLSGESDRPPELLGHNSTFWPAHEIRFEREGLGRGVLADATGPWLRRMAKEGVERLAVSLEHCPYDVLINAPQPWGIISDGDVGVEVWQPTWKRRVRSHTDPSPWRVCYSATRAGRWNQVTPPDEAEARRLLESVIREASYRSHVINEMADTSRLSLYPDLFPATWDTEASELGNLGALVANVVRSESWQAYSPLPEHEDLTQKLWRAGLRAMEAAANAYCHASEHPTSQGFLRTG